MGVIFDVKRMALRDGPGIRTTVFLKGCSLSCLWCHNPEGQASHPELLYDQSACLCCRLCEKSCPIGVHRFSEKTHRIDRRRCTACGSCVRVCPSRALRICGQEATVKEVLNIVKKDRVFYDTSGGGLTLSGGEPLNQPVFVLEILKAAKREQIHTILETNGYWNWHNMAKLLPYVDSIRYDIKHLDSKKHTELTGVSNIQILENLARLVAVGQHLVVVVPLIRGINDDADNIDALLKFLESLNYKPVLNLLPYHDYYQSKSRQLGINARLFSPPSREQMKRIRETAVCRGFEVLNPSAPFQSQGETA